MAGKSRREILEEVWKYTKIPVCITGLENRQTICAGMVPGEMEEKRKYVMELPEGNGRIEVYPDKEITKAEAEELLNMLVQSCRMGSKKREKEADTPDYLWILSEDQEDGEEIYRLLKGRADTAVKVQKEGERELFLSRIRGKEDRDFLIGTLKSAGRLINGRVLVGNGFSALQSKAKNLEMQRYVFEIVRKKKARRKICLVEQYYHDLAVTYIGSRIEEENLFVEELEYVETEDSEKGKDLYDTLYWYLKMRRNVARTATKLRIHRNTLIPRLVQLNKMIGIDDKEGEECERLLMVMEMKKVKN